MKNLQNKIAVISGAGSGIGQQLAIQLAAQGVQLALNDYNPDSLAKTVSLVSPHTQVISQVFDVSVKAAWLEFAEKVLSHYGKVDIVINNAGVALGRISVLDVSYEDFEWLVGINMWGMIYGTKSFLPHLVKSEEASIVNISSLFGIMGVAYQAPYCTTKFAIRGFTESLRIEMMDRHPHVTVTSVHPGGIKTNIAKSSRWPQNMPAEKKAKGIKNFERFFKTPAPEAAKQIIDAIATKKNRLLIGKDATWMDRLVRWMPSYYAKWLLRGFKRMEKKMQG